MTFKNIILGTAASCLAMSGAIAADLPAGGAEPAGYVTVSNTFGEGYINIPGSESFYKLNGDVRSRYLFNMPGGGDPNGKIDGRARFGVDFKRETGIGIASATAKVSLEFDSKGDSSVGVGDAFGSLGGLSLGKQGYAGNITYSNYAVDGYHVDNSGPLLGYNLGVGFGTSVALTVATPTGGSDFIPNIGAAAKISQGWGDITLGGGAVSHEMKGADLDYDLMHPDAMKDGALLTKLTKTHDDYEEHPNISTFGWYGGGGLEMPIPGLADSTKLGASGFYFSGANITNIGSQSIYERRPTCADDDATCLAEHGPNKIGDVTVAGRILRPGTPANGDLECKAGVEAADCTANTDDKDIMSRPRVVADYYTSDQFKELTDDEKSSLKTLEGDRFNPVRVAGSDEDDLGYQDKYYSTSGFSANAGLNHSFSSDISLGVNGGFFMVKDGDYSQLGYTGGGKLNYSPVTNTTFSLGGSYSGGSVSYSGDDDNISTAFGDDGDGSVDANISVTLEISQAF